MRHQRMAAGWRGIGAILALLIGPQCTDAPRLPALAFGAAWPAPEAAGWHRSCGSGHGSIFGSGMLGRLSVPSRPDSLHGRRAPPVARIRHLRRLEEHGLRIKALKPSRTASRVEDIIRNLYPDSLTSASTWHGRQRATFPRRDDHGNESVIDPHARFNGKYITATATCGSRARHRARSNARNARRRPQASSPHRRRKASRRPARRARAWYRVS